MQFFLFLFSLFLYILTIPPDIYWGDNPETVISFYFAGKYFIDLPFFSACLGKLFTFIPCGNIPFRVNLFCAFVSGLTVIVFFNVMSFFLKDTEKRISEISTFFGCMFFLASHTLWKFATNGESVSFIFFCYLFLLYMVLRFCKQDIRVLYFASFILAFFFNFSTILDFYFQFFIIIFIYMYILNPKMWRNFLLFYIFGLLFFSAVYIVERRHYKLDMLVFLDHYLKLLSNTFKVSAVDILKYLISLLYYLINQLSFYILIFSVLGIFYLYKFKKKEIYSLFLLFFSPFVFTCTKASFEDIFSYEHHFFTVYLLFFIFFGWTIYFMLRYFSFKISIGILALLFSINIVYNFQLCDKSNLKFARKETLNLFYNIEKNAMIIMPSLEIKKLLNYFQIIENKRKDMTVIAVADFSNPVFLELMKKNRVFFDDTIPVLDADKISKNIDFLLKHTNIRSAYFLLPERCLSLEEKILCNSYLLNYKSKKITTFESFKGERKPLPFVYNLIKIEK